jgi:hypothetical protein
MSSRRYATTGELPLGGGALKGSLIADDPGATWQFVVSRSLE